MKLTPIQARNKVAKELDKGNGAYIDARFYKVRVSAGVLQVSYDFETWTNVAPGSEIRNGHGRAIFVYEPDNSYKRLTVVSALGIHPGYEWVNAFQVGHVVEVVRETATQYIIAPMGFEQKVYKSTGMLAGYKGSKHSIEFKVTEPVQVPKPLKPFEFGQWAVWQGTAQILLSDESVKKLREFKTVDECINWLFVNDYKEAARALNSHAKGA